MMEVCGDGTNRNSSQLSLRKHAHIIYSNFFSSKIENFQQENFDIFLIFAQNRDTLELPPRGSSNEDRGEAVLTSTHNLCFGAKIRKIGTPLHTAVLLYKSGVQGVIHVTDMFS